MDPLSEKKFSNRRLKTDVENPLGERKFYYPSLDGLRFLAFLIVFIHHIYQTTFHVDNPVGNFFVTIFRTNGWIGVDLFLILSGFLITTLLLKEKLHHGSFSLKNFYIRRGLRIWPLYYFALILSFFIIPFFLGQLNNPTYQQSLRELPLYALFLGNWAVIFDDFNKIRSIALLWTISLEQQFYFLWPLVLLSVNRFRTALYYCLSLILFSILLRWVLFQFNDVQHPNIYVNTFTRLDTLVFGGLLGAINIYHPNWKNYLKPILNLPSQLVVLLVLAVFLFWMGETGSYQVRHSIWGYTVIGLFMGYFITSALETHSLFAKALSNKVLVWLGKISYGLYVYHIMSLELSRYLLDKTQLAFLVPFLALGITILISWGSYELFEKKFLKLKDKFTKISSRPV